MNQLNTIARRQLMARGFLPDFSDAALAEAGSAVPPSGAGDAQVRDLRTLLWASIDNDSSRDLDQLSVAEVLPSGAVRVRVAIADVDALAPRGSAIDGHAEANTVTVYTAAAIYPMIPEHLSTDVTSLSEGADRLALVVDMEVAADGSLGKTDVYRAWVHNYAKLAYNSVAAWLDGQAPAPARVTAVKGIAEQLRLQEGAAQALRKRRFEHGALSLQTPRAEAVFSGDQLTDLRSDSGNRAKELIEDLMVAANGVVARFLTAKRFPSLRRVLRSPQRWPRIRTLAEEQGESLPAQANGPALSAFLAKRRQAAPDKYADLSLSIVKLLGRGEYVVNLPGAQAIAHFGLAADDYAHATAPNRRFADLVTQRLLKAAIAGAPIPYTAEQLSNIATHCNDQEANSAKVERQVEKSAAAQLLASRIHERFDGVVTGASEKGTFVRINHPATEGKIVRGAQGLDVGDRVQVELVHLDIEQGFLDFERVGR